MGSYRNRLSFPVDAERKPTWFGNPGENPDEKGRVEESRVGNDGGQLAAYNIACTFNVDTLALTANVSQQ